MKTIRNPEDENVEIVHGNYVVRWNPTRKNDSGSFGRVNNFGDLLGPIIVRKILDLNNIGPDGSDHRRLLTVESILHLARPGDIVWGSGINGKVPGRKTGSMRLDVRAVRGPRTRDYLENLGVVVPKVYGDPAILMPFLFPEVRSWCGKKTRSVVVIPNLNDLRSVEHDPRCVDPRQNVWAVIRAIAESEFVVASSLHALILADALGIPNRGVISPHEHYSKYVDYYSGTGRYAVDLADSISGALDQGPVEPGTYDIDALYESFPLDLWIPLPGNRKAPESAVPRESVWSEVEHRIDDWEKYSGDVLEDHLPALLRKLLGVLEGDLVKRPEQAPSLMAKATSLIRRLPYKLLNHRLNPKEQQTLAAVIVNLQG